MTVSPTAKVGHGRLAPADVRRVLASGTNSWGKPVAPHGLYLARVEYPPAAFSTLGAAAAGSAQEDEKDGALEEGEGGGSGVRHRQNIY